MTTYIQNTKQAQASYLLRNHMLHLLFLLLMISPNLFAQENMTENIRKANECFAQVEKNNVYKDNLNQVDMNMLPMGIKRTIGNTGVTIAVHSAELHQEYTSLGIFLRLNLPGRGKDDPLMFGAEEIKLSHDGDIIGDAKLTLMSDIEVPVGSKNVIIRLKGNYDKKTGQTDGLTYVSIDCKGFKELALTAEVELSDNLCIPVDAKGTRLPGKVKGNFHTVVTNWSDIVASVNLPSFEVKGLSGFIWNLQNCIIDFSEMRNEEKMIFPAGYSKFLIPGHEVLWKGLFVQDLSVTLPPQFAKGDKGDKRVSFSAHNMLIDEQGITGDFGVDNLLSFDEGNASGWSFSVDQFRMRLLTNNLEEARFKGTLGLPVSEKAKLGYDGQIYAGDKYVMRVNSIDDIPFDLFHAKAKIEKNSYVEFKVDKGKFRPEAMLNGSMRVYVSKSDTISTGKNGTNKPDSASLLAFNGIKFQELHLQTESPYFTAQSFGYEGDAKLGPFPVSVKEIALRTNGNEASLAIGVDLSLADDGIIKGGTRIELAGKMEEGNLQRWRFSKLKVDKININATIAELMTLKGEVEMMNDDPVYGDCFAGKIAVKFNEKKGPVKGLNAEMRAMFGRKDFRYWFVDGIASIPGKGIPVAPGLNLTGFGGGISCKMKPDGVARGVAGQILTATSMTYVPDQSYSLGVKAATMFNFMDKKLATGEACFELAFNDKGGLNYAGFYGYAQFMDASSVKNDDQKQIRSNYSDIAAKEQELAKKYGGDKGFLEKTKQYDPQAAGNLYTDKDKLGKTNFTAALGMQYNFSESSFHANFDLYVNALGGMLTGVGEGNRAGSAVLHIDPKDWYIHLGRPDNPIGLRMGFGKILNIETDSYLMMGTQIAAAPSLPSQVASILKEKPEDLDYMKELNTIQNGKGVAFGSRMSINTGDLTFLVLYAHYAAGMGFDLMLKDYGDAQCKGMSGAIGLNGWYANGQAYAYLSGELGVKVNLWFMKAKVPIITTDMAALLQAKLPNPTSFKAYFAVNAKVLGLVKVNCRFKMLLGDDCELVIPGGSPLEMAMISDLSPTDKDKDISVFTAPQATFNMAIEKPFKVQDDSGEKTFRIKLKDFVLSDGQQAIPGYLKWNTDKDAASFYSKEVLPPQKNITATVNVIFEELKNNRWTSVYTAGKEAVESKTISFTTNDAPENIPVENIVYSYPVVAQKYYLKGESSKGYIQLQHGQKYLFPAGMDNKISLKDNAGRQQLVGFTYDEGNRRILFDMPQTSFGTDYAFSLLSMSKAGQTTAVSATADTLLSSGEDGSISSESRKAVAETRTDIGKELLAYNFSTSRYATFSDKINGIRKGNAAAIKLSSSLLMLEYETIGMEPFDPAELTGVAQTEGKPLIDASAKLDDSYYSDKIYPLIYKDYPANGTIRLKNRNESDYGGIPPTKALPLIGEYRSAVEAGLYGGIATRKFPYYYNQPQVYKSDFTDLQYQVVNDNLQNTGNETYRRFLENSFPLFPAGAYRIRLQYILPGGVKGTTCEFEYKNFIQ